MQKWGVTVSIRCSRIGWCVVLLLALTSVAAAFDRTPLTAAEGEQLLAEVIRYATVEWHDGENVRRGVPYQWGGRLSVDEFLQAVEAGAGAAGMGVDASGLVVSAIRTLWPHFSFYVQQGSEMVPVRDINSALLFRWNVQAIDVDDLRPGDLIFFSDSSGGIGGVGIYERTVGRNIRFVVASANAGSVIQTSVNRDGEYWATRFAGAGRLLRGDADG